jgi:transposase
MNTSICGIDIASKSCRCALQGENHKFIFNREFPLNNEGKNTLLGLLPSHSMVIMESTGHYHLPWARSIQGSGHDVFVLNAFLASKFCSASNALRSNKTDPIDAAELSEIGARQADKIQNYRFKEEPARQALLTLCRVMQGLRTTIKQILQSATSMLEMMLPEISCINLHHNKSFADLFLTISSLESLRRLHRSTILKYACTVTDEFIRGIRGYISAWQLFDPMLPALQSLLKQAQALREILLQTDEDIRRAYKAMPQKHKEIKLALTIPGFGPKTAPTILASLPDNWMTWGTNKRKLSRKLQAFFGCDPRMRKSGNWGGQIHLSKRGIRIARTALFQTCVIGLIHDLRLRTAYDLQRAKGKHHLVAITHLMRIQLQRLVAIMVNSKPYVADYDTAAQAA